MLSWLFAPLYLTTPTTTSVSSTLCWWLDYLQLFHTPERFVQLPWDRALAGPEKVWFAIYDPAQERRLRLRIAEFERATKTAKHSWTHLDLTNLFAQWMAEHEYREAYFEEPEDMELALRDFAEFVSQQIVATLSGPDVGTDTVVAISGLASLFGLTPASAIFET